jgi:CheY-like chemotaxis protein
VLFAEDQKVNQQVTLRILTAVLKVSDVTTADDGEQALALYRERPRDLVLMDILMPRCLGTEATRQIRQYEIQRGLFPARVVALTSCASREELNECIAAGMDAVLTKPLRTDQLRHELSLTSEHLARRPVGPASCFEATPPASPKMLAAGTADETDIGCGIGSVSSHDRD